MRYAPERRFEKPDDREQVAHQPNARKQPLPRLRLHARYEREISSSHGRNEFPTEKEVGEP